MTNDDLITNRDTDTLEDVEKRIHAELKVLKDPQIQKDVKKGIVKKVNNLIKHVENINGKKLNNKTYPIKQKPVEWTLEKLLKEIKDVEPEFRDCGMDYPEETKIMILQQQDTTGGSPRIGENRFTFRELGWPEPKHKFNP